MSNLKKIIPLIFVVIFIFLIHRYYKNNVNDFAFIYQINILLIIWIIFLSFVYLLTEALVLKNIVNNLNKKINLLESFFIMNSTYFCNTFVQFSGLGYRLYYLKKYKNLMISQVLGLSLFTIACEVLIFSLLGIFSLIFIDLVSNSININLILYLVFTSFFILSTFYLLSSDTLRLKILNIKIFKKFNIINSILNKMLINIKNKKNFIYKQSILFLFQYIILFLIFFSILNVLNTENYFYLSLLITSLVDFSFLLAFTPYSVGITEVVTILGTKDINFSLAETLVLINFFRVCMLSIYFLFGPLFLIYKAVK